MLYARQKENAHTEQKQTHIYISLLAVAFTYIDISRLAKPRIVPEQRPVARMVYSRCYYYYSKQTWTEMIHYGCDDDDDDYYTLLVVDAFFVFVVVPFVFLVLLESFEAAFWNYSYFLCIRGIGKY